MLWHGLCPYLQTLGWAVISSLFARSVINNEDKVLNIDNRFPIGACCTFSILFYAKNKQMRQMLLEELMGLVQKGSQ